MIQAAVAVSAIAGTALGAGRLHRPAPVKFADADLGHLEIMTYYDFNASAQHGWAVGTFDPYQLAEWGRYNVIPGSVERFGVNRCVCARGYVGSISSHNW